jgi:hypothetical protein
MWTKPVNRSLGVKIGIAVAVSLAVLNLVWLIIGYSGLYQSITSSVAQGGSAPLLNQAVIRRDLMIELALLIAAAGMLCRNVTGLMLSLVALIWVVIEYVWWFIWTKQTIAAAGLAELPSGIPHAWNLAGATAWNLVVLVVAVCLFIWQARVTRETLRA